MESTSVLEMYQHSERLYNIYYRPFIDDGDNSSYGITIVIEKSACTNHETKRVKSQLRKFFQNYQGNFGNMQKFKFLTKKCVTTN